MSEGSIFLIADRHICALQDFLNIRFSKVSLLLNTSSKQFFSASARAPPSDVKVETVSSSSLKVSWVPPQELPDYYQVHLGPNVYNATSDARVLLVPGLEGCKRYVVTVHSIYDKGTADFASASSSGTTDVSSKSFIDFIIFNLFYNDILSTVNTQRVKEMLAVVKVDM